MKRYPDKFFALAIVDPPYGIGESNKQRSTSAKNDNRWKSRKENWTDYKKKDWDNEIPTDEYWKELFRVSKNQIVWGGNFFSLPLHSGWIFWDKLNGESDFSDGELAWTSFDCGVRVFRYLWSGFRKEKPEERIHQTQKPIALYEWTLRKYAEEGWNILDTHLGSGSSRIACHKAGLDFVGCEKDADHFTDEEKRFDEYLTVFKQQLPMQFAAV
jgi:site-specific DNA-methyltransferase (adenine-specific)